MPQTTPHTRCAEGAPALDPILLAHVACCLEYPGEDTRKGARLAAERFEASCPAMAEALRELAAWIEGYGVEGARERYIAVFEMNPVCTLDVSWHLWGDTYDRGAFLAEIARELREARLDPGDEMPDWLPTLLRLLERINDLEDLRLLTESILLPGLDRMVRRLDAAQVKLPWVGVLRALPEVLGEGRWKAADVPHALSLLGSAGQGGCCNA